MALGTTSSTALAGDTTTISGAQASAITANTDKVVLTAAADSGIAISGAGAISADVTAGPIKVALDAVSSGDTTALSQTEYRLERMLLLLCNTLGLEFAHLVRAVDATTFDEYARFGAIEVNKNDLYTQTSNQWVAVTAMSTQLCSAGLAANNALGCDGSLVRRHALTYCAAATCDSDDFSSTGTCCIAP